MRSLMARQWNRDMRHLVAGKIPVRAYSTQNQESAPTQSQTRPRREDSIEIFEAVAGKLFVSKSTIVQAVTMHGSASIPYINNNQDHGAHNVRWKWLRDIDVNNASFPKQAAGSYPVFSDGGHTLHERKDFTVEAAPIDPVAVKSTRKKAWIGLAIGLLLLAPGIPSLSWV